jgi:hypothetical protein
MHLHNVKKCVIKWINRHKKRGAKMGRPTREDGRKARTVANNKYNTNNYDRINLVVKKGEKDKIKAQAERSGESVNGFINRILAAEVPGFEPVENK